jgi:hypothetical protein
MKKAEVEKLLKHDVLPHLDGFAVAGRMIHCIPTKSLLRAFFLDQTSSPFDLQLYCFVLPLYVPTDHVHFNFGLHLSDPLRGNQGWDFSPVRRTTSATTLTHVVRHATESFLDGIQTPLAFAQYCEKAILSRRDDPHARLGAAFSWILAGEPARALKELTRLQLPSADEQYSWRIEVSRTAAQVESVLVNEGLSGAQAQLEAWVSASKSALRLA